MADKKKTGKELDTLYVSLTVEADGLAEDAAKEVEKAGEKAGEKGGKAAGKEFKTGLVAGAKKAGVAAGAAAAAGMALGLKDAAASRDFAGLMQAQIGETSEYSGKIIDDAQAVYRSGWGESLEHVGGIARAASHNYDKISTDLENVTKQALGLEKAFGDEGTQIMATAASMVANGLAENMESALGVLAKGYQAHEKLGEDLLDNFSEYGEAFQLLGLDASETIGLFKQGLEAGAWTGDQISDALREYTIIAGEMGEEAAGAYASIGLSAEDMQRKILTGGESARQALDETMDGLRGIEDPVLRATSAIAIFGPKAEEMGDSLFALDLDTAAKEAGFYGDAMSKAADDVVQNAAGMDVVLEGLGRTLNEGLGLAMEPLLPMLDQLGTSGLEFFRWLGENPAITQTIMAVATALGVLAGGVGIVNAAMNLNPVIRTITIVIGIIGGLVAAVQWLLANWEEVSYGIDVAATHAFNGILNLLNFGIHTVNGFIEILNGLGLGQHSKMGLIDLKEIPEPPPGLQTGGTVTRGGTVLVGEAGPELLQLPAGASVIPLDHPAANVPTAGASGPLMTVTNINPVAERGSASTYKASQLLGALIV